MRSRLCMLVADQCMVLSGQRCRGLGSRVVGRVHLVRCLAMFVQSITRPENPVGFFFPVLSLIRTRAISHLFGILGGPDQCPRRICLVSDCVV